MLNKPWTFTLFCFTVKASKRNREQQHRAKKLASFNQSHSINYGSSSVLNHTLIYIYTTPKQLFTGVMVPWYWPSPLYSRSNRVQVITEMVHRGDTKNSWKTPLWGKNHWETYTPAQAKCPDCNAPFPWSGDSQLVNTIPVTYEHGSTKYSDKLTIIHMILTIVHMLYN